MSHAMIDREGDRCIGEVMCLACFNIYVVQWHARYQTWPWADGCVFCKARSVFLTDGVH